MCAFWCILHSIFSVWGVQHSTLYTYSERTKSAFLTFLSSHSLYAIVCFLFHSFPLSSTSKPSRKILKTIYWIQFTQRVLLWIPVAFIGWRNVSNWIGLRFENGTIPLGTMLFLHVQQLQLLFIRITKCEWMRKNTHANEMAGNKGLSWNKTQGYTRKKRCREWVSEREREREWRKIDRKHIERYICLQRDDGNTKKRLKAKLQ